jgi:anti-sigma regulatory factor (Ser/Thr protein kinase)/ABC-type transporter Mla MlaB component
VMRAPLARVGAVTPCRPLLLICCRLNPWRSSPPRPAPQEADRAMEWLSLSGDLTRENAVEQLLAQSTSADADSELCLHAGPVRRVDAVAAAAFRLRMARHHREHEQGTVTLVLPSEPEVAARLSALLDPPPERVTLAGQVDAQPPANYALVPATTVSDSHAAVALGGWTLEACERARISRRRRAFVTTAAMELADNAVIHAQKPTDPPVVALTSLARGRFIELAVLDTGRGIAESDDPRETLRAIPRRALDGEPGFLGDILQRARTARMQVQVQILAGTGRLLWTAMQHRTVVGRYLPGTTIIVRVAGERTVDRPSSSG